jgi:hypothetical protein
MESVSTIIGVLFASLLGPVAGIMLFILLEAH